MRGDVVRGENATDRIAAGNALRGRDDVGTNADLLVGEEGARTRAPRLDLIHDEERMVLVAELADALCELRVNRQNAAFALHGLEDDGAGAVRNLLLESLDVVEGKMRDGAGTRPEAERILVLTAHAHRKERAAVEAVREGNDFILLFAVKINRGAAGKLQGAFIRFGARVREEDAVEARHLRNLSRKLKGRIVRENVAHVNETGALRFKRLSHGLRRIAERIDGNAAAEIEVGAAFAVVEAALFAAHQNEVRWLVTRKHDLIIGRARNFSHH